MIARLNPLNLKGRVMFLAHRDSADSLATLLQITGNETYLAHDGIEVIELIEKHRPEVVLLDIGFAETKRSRSMQACAETALGQRYRDDRVDRLGTRRGRKSEEAGFNGHLVKPVDYDKLLKLSSTLTNSADIKL